MEAKYQRGHKLYLDKAETKESEVNIFLACRDGVVEMVSYNDCSGYGSPTKLYYCTNSKHESKAIIRATYNDMTKEWQEESMYFDSDSFAFFKALINGKEDVLGGKFELLRDY